MQHVIFRIVLASAFVALLAIAAQAQVAGAQTHPPTPISEALTTGYQLGMQTGQQVTAALMEAESRLKYVLDHWVPRQPETPK